MSVPPLYRPFVQSRQELIARTHDENLKKHFQAEIDLVASWGSGDIVDPPPTQVDGPRSGNNNPSTVHTPDPASCGCHGHGGGGRNPKTSQPGSHSSTGLQPGANMGQHPPEPINTGTNKGKNKPVKSNNGLVPHGYAKDWHTIRFGNTTNEPITIHVTMASGNSPPRGVDGRGMVTIPAGGYVDLTFAPGSSFNFKSTKGDGSVWNQGELFFDEARHIIWGNMSYIYGANSNMRIFSEDGQHSGYLGDIFENVPSGARVGNWGIKAPYDRFKKSDDPNDPDSAAGGPNGPKNAGASYLYSIIPKGEGYVGRGRPVEITDYDDASSLGFTGNVAVVF